MSVFESSNFGSGITPGFRILPACQQRSGSVVGPTYNSLRTLQSSGIFDSTRCFEHEVHRFSTVLVRGPGDSTKSVYVSRAIRTWTATHSSKNMPSIANAGPFEAHPEKTLISDVTSLKFRVAYPVRTYPTLWAFGYFASWVRAAVYCSSGY